MTRKVSSGWLICGLGLIAPLGCASSRPKSMDSALFIPPAIQQNSDSLIEPGPTVVSAKLPPDVLEGESPKNATVLPITAGRGFDSVPPLDPLVATPTTAPVAEVTDTNDTAVPASASLRPVPEPMVAGVYMTLGGVLAQVNNTPIYANQVLSPLRKEFAAKARDYTSDDFREFAQKEIGRQLQELIEDELYFATAYHALSDEDRKLADAITMQVRMEKVTAAGGSVEKAKQIALADEGVDLDESMKQEYRRIVHGLYQRRRIEPLIQVTADNMREFYRLNVGKLYSQKDRAQFRVIKIDPQVAGGKLQATDKINALREKAIHGDDFAMLAASVNDDSFLKKHSGNPCDEGGWMERNTYCVDAVEAAVWQLQPGQVTPVIEADGNLYIAKLLARQNGYVRPFEDLTVQDDIYNQIRQKQMGDLWNKSKDESVSEAMVITDEKRIQVAVDMAMQGYTQARIDGNHTLTTHDNAMGVPDHPAS